MKVATMYMIPISLWSVVVSQRVQPVRLVSTSWAVTWGTGATVVAIVGFGLSCGC